MRVILGNMGVMRIPKRILTCWLMMSSIGQRDAFTGWRTCDSSKSKQSAFLELICTAVKAAIDG